MEPNQAAPSATADTGAQASEATNDSTESLEQSQEQSTQEAKSDKATTPPTPKVEEPKRNIKKFKLKVDKEEVEEEIDLDNEEEVAKRLQLAKVAQKRMKESSDLQKEVVKFVEKLKADPFGALSDPSLGIDVKDAVAKFIEKEIQDQQKSPEQLRAEQLENELKKIQKEREDEREGLKQKELELLTQKAVEDYDRKIDEALGKSTLPKSPYIIKKIADYMMMGLQEGLDVTPADVIPLVEEEMKKDLKEMFSVMPEEVVEQLIGKEVFNKVRKKNIAKVKQSMSTAVKAPDVGAKPQAEEQPTKKMTIKEFLKV